MSKHYFISDTHFCHENIIKYENRPFKSVKEMDDTLIHNINLRIKDEDNVYFLGDFMFHNGEKGKKGEGLPIKAETIVKKLKGRWIFIAGNHDKSNSLKTKIISVILELGGMKIKCVHRPEHASKDYPLNLVGHVHGKWLYKELSPKSVMINCSVEMHKYAPIEFSEIMSIYSKWKKERGTKKND
jgi:calcineurin-like phosphoesterase family protein